jgi:hypothetical protein
MPPPAHSPVPSPWKMRPIRASLIRTNIWSPHLGRPDDSRSNNALMHWRSRSEPGIGEPKWSERTCRRGPRRPRRQLVKRRHGRWLPMSRPHLRAPPRRHMLARRTWTPPVAPFGGIKSSPHNGPGRSHRPNPCPNRSRLPPRLTMRRPRFLLRPPVGVPRSGPGSSSPLRPRSSSRSWWGSACGPREPIPSCPHRLTGRRRPRRRLRHIRSLTPSSSVSPRA